MKITKLNFINIFIIFTGIIVVIDMWMIFIWVPTEINQGAIQRILYLHVPVAWGSMAAICIVAFSSIMYLYKKSEKWDRIALSAAESGAIFGAMMLFSGMLWARPVWGVFWTGEAKLTFSLILFILFIAYLMFRALDNYYGWDSSMGRDVRNQPSLPIQYQYLLFHQYKL